MFDKILVAVDPKGFNSAIIERAIALTKATQAQLKLISVLTEYGEGAPPMFAYPGIGGYPPVMEDSLWQDYQTRYEAYANQGLTRLKNLKQQIKAAGIQAEITQCLDNPGHAICYEAKTWNADLIMVGSRGRKGLSELLLGSVSNYVMHHAACSVMVVHTQQDEEMAHHTQQQMTGTKAA